MEKSRFTETQIFSILKEAESGLPVKDVCRGNSSINHAIDSNRCCASQSYRTVRL